jgi:hypothetical protein
MTRADAPPRTFTIEDLIRILPTQREAFRHLAQQLQDLRDVIIVFIVFSSGLRLEQVIARQQLEEQTRSRPHVHALIPTRSQNDLRTPVLPRLNVVGKVMINPTGVAQIGNFDRDTFERDGVVWERRGEHVGIARDGRLGVFSLFHMVRLVCRVVLQIVKMRGGRRGGYS